METQSKDKVYVIGHKNPDTDSICSSICYAYLKLQITGDDYVPMRAGEINAETKYVLNAFSAAVPEYMENVSTQVKDVEYRHIDGVDGEISIKNAWGNLKRIRCNHASIGKRKWQFSRTDHRSRHRHDLYGSLRQPCHRIRTHTI